VRSDIPQDEEIVQAAWVKLLEVVPLLWNAQAQAKLPGWVVKLRAAALVALKF